MLSQEVRQKLEEEISLLYSEIDLIHNSLETLEDSEGELLFNHLVEERNRRSEQ